MFWQTDGDGALEGYLHGLFAPRRRYYEWFDLGPSRLAAVSFFVAGVTLWTYRDDLSAPQVARAREALLALVARADEEEELALLQRVTAVIEAITAPVLASCADRAKHAEGDLS